MVVLIVVNAVAPNSDPAIPCEPLFEVRRSASPGELPANALFIAKPFSAALVHQVLKEHCKAHPEHPTGI
jgi:hypothetical protein